MNTPTDPQTPENVPPTAPRVPPAVKARVIALHIAGESNRQIAKKLKMSKDTVSKILKEGQIGANVSNSSPERALALAGITSERVGEKLAELMEAKEVKRATFEGHFTDSAVDPDNAVQFRAVELAAKIRNMLPKEETNVAAQLFVRLPDVSLTPGHPKTCTCEACCRAWEQLPAAEVIEP